MNNPGHRSLDPKLRDDRRGLLAPSLVLTGCRFGDVVELPHILPFQHRVAFAVADYDRSTDTNSGSVPG